MTTVLEAYNRARAALAEAATIDAALSLIDEIPLIKLYARQVRDRALMEQAMVLQMRAERRLGVLMKAAEEQGQLLARGQKKKDNPDVPTLDEVDIDRKLSMVAKRAAALEEEAFEEAVERAREKFRAGRAIIIDPLADGPINGSRAVMSSRVEPDDSLDYFPTPPWATRALMEHVMPLIGVDPGEYTAWEPACGEGHIAEVLREYFDGIIATDIFAHGYGEELDFLSNEARFCRADWIITNPPFGDLAEQFTLRALEMAKYGVAMFVRLQWLEGVGRYAEIFAKHPPTVVAFFSERVNLCKGRWDPEGSTATAYIWLVWDKYEPRQPPFWIPPGCREGLSKPDDVERFTARPVMKRKAAEQEGEAA